MAWARLDDSRHDHPKILALGDDVYALAAVGLLDHAITWAARHRSKAASPGLVPWSFWRSRAGKHTKRLTGLLLEAGLVDPDPADLGLFIHDHADYAPKRDHAEASEAGRKGAAVRWQTDSNSHSNSHQTAIAKNGSRADARSYPSRPVPTRPVPTTKDGPLSLVSSADDQENGGPSQEDQQTAELANTIAAARPGWTPRTVAAVIRRKRAESIGWHRITIALLIVATDPGSQVPHRIHAPGYWWDENDSRYQAALDRPALAAFLERKTA